MNINGIFECTQTLALRPWAPTGRVVTRTGYPTTCDRNVFEDEIAATPAATKNIVIFSR